MKTRPSQGMPFIAQCPHCRSAKVQAPSRKRGTDHTCPKCGQNFPLEPWDETALPVSYKLPPVEFDLNAAYHAPAADDFAEAPTQVYRPVQFETNATPSEVLPVPDMPEAPLSYTPDVKRLEPALVLTFAAGGLFGVAMVATQFPYGRFAALPLLVIGAAMALLALPQLDVRKSYGWAVFGLNVFGLLLVTMFPSALGIDTWLPRGDPNAGPKPVLAVPRDGGAPVPSATIDARIAMWRQDDVQWDVARVSLEPTAPKSKTLTLRVTLKLMNVGVARPLPFAPWPPETPPKLVADGVALTFHKVESQPGSANPGKDVDVVLAFAPPDKLTDLTLELPPLNGTDPVRMTIPQALIAREKKS